MYFNKKHKTRAFTLVELLVIISISALISGMVLVRYNQSSSRTILVNFAHDVALTIRQAQVFGTSVRESGTGTEEFPFYGVHIENTPTTSLILFADLDRDGEYDGALENLDVYTLGEGFTISGICGVYTETCDPLTSIDIAFIRPNPEATITGDPGLSGPYASAAITLRDPFGMVEVVQVYANGQISVGGGAGIEGVWTDVGPTVSCGSPDETVGTPCTPLGATAFDNRYFILCLDAQPLECLAQ